MRSFSSFRSWIYAVTATVVAASSVFGEGPPSQLVEGLKAEAYPDRVAAERALQAWAEDNGEVAKQWLLGQYRGSENPEVRRRALSVLKAVVVGELTRRRPGFVGIGMGVVKLPEETGMNGFGVEIRSISPGTPAESSGLRVTDVIMTLDGLGWANRNAQHEFAGRIGAKHGGDKIRLEVFREGKTMEFELVLASRPWSAGEYNDKENLQLQGDPFAARNGLLLDEEKVGKEAQRKAFQDWLRQQGAGTPAR